MGTDAVAIVEAGMLKRDRGGFAPGDTVRVHVKVIEGEKERVQVFEGMVIRKRGEWTGNVRSTPTPYDTRRTVNVARAPSPRVERVQVMKSGHVRRAKLFYLRARTGKAARLREKRPSQPIAE